MEEIKKLSCLLKSNLNCLKIIYLLIPILTIFSCHSPDHNTSDEGPNKNNSQLYESSESKVYDTFHNFPYQLDSSFNVHPVNYSVEFLIKRTFNGDSIAIDVISEIDTTGSGEVVTLFIHYNNKIYRINSLYFDYPIYSKSDLLDFRKYESNIHFKDYNFDNHPDLVIRNKPRSGNKNQVYDIFLYIPSQDDFVKNRFLTSLTNPGINNENKTISMFAEGGMASQIYWHSTYKWVDEEFKLIENIEQDYIDSIDKFIRITKKLEDTSWIKNVDTLSHDELKK